MGSVLAIASICVAALVVTLWVLGDRETRRLQAMANTRQINRVMGLERQWDICVKHTWPSAEGKIIWIFNERLQREVQEMVGNEVSLDTYLVCMVDRQRDAAAGIVVDDSIWFNSSLVFNQAMQVATENGFPNGIPRNEILN